MSTPTFARKEGCCSDSLDRGGLRHGQALDQEDIDSVLIATPGFLHREMLLQVLERELPILCEKPLTPHAPSSWEILEAEQRLKKKRIQVASCAASMQSISIYEA